MVWPLFLDRIPDLDNLPTVQVRTETCRILVSILNSSCHHFAVFIVVLRTYPEWRMAWFPLVAIVEVPYVAMALELCLQRMHRRHLGHRARNS